MPHLEKAEAKHETSIQKLLDELELGPKQPPFDDFFVYVDDGDVIGIVELIDGDDFVFLCRFGIEKDMQGKGFGTAFLKDCIKRCDKDIYLYTVIPGFFERCGFVKAPFDKRLPPQKMFGCESCSPNLCRCMVRRNA